MERAEDLQKEMNEMLELAINAAVTMMESEKLPKALAKYCQNFFNALVDEGFTSKAAIQVVCSLKFPEMKR